VKVDRFIDALLGLFEDIFLNKSFFERLLLLSSFLNLLEGVFDGENFPLFSLLVFGELLFFGVAGLVGVVMIDFPLKE